MSAPSASSLTDGGDSRNHRRRHSLQPLEWLTLIHVGVLIIAATWAFGGQSDWVRPRLTAWASLGSLITLAALLNGEVRGTGSKRLWWWFAPVALFNVVVLWSATNPSFREVRMEAETFLVASPPPHLGPSAARPALAREALWVFDALWLSCFNLALVIRRRRALRGLLLLFAVNGLALAIFGTVQKLSHAQGVFFGLVPTPQKYFFASFVYHNHWGAFALLVMAASIGLLAYYQRRIESRNFLHSPAATGLVAVLLVAATIPLSASRSSTILAAILLTAALLRWTTGLVRKRRHFNESIAPPLAIAAIAIVLAVGAIWHLAHDTITARSALTVEQIRQAALSASPDARATLYRDTMRMAADKPWFGWGMASYPHVFTLYNTRESIDQLPVFYHDAHSDWLQALAEHGVVGTILLALAVVLPLATVGRRVFSHSITMYLLSGCAILLLYSGLEFPFGNFAVVLTWWFCLFAALRYTQLRDTTTDSGSPFSPGTAAAG